MTYNIISTWCSDLCFSFHLCSYKCKHTDTEPESLQSPLRIRPARNEMGLPGKTLNVRLADASRSRSEPSDNFGRPCADAHLPSTPPSV